MTAPLSIGFLGGLPPALGGGGLERQMRETAAALAKRGNDIVWLERVAQPPSALDAVHAFGAEPNVWHLLRHAPPPVPLVVSPVIVVSPGREENVLRLAARLPLLTAARMRRETVGRADAVVALTTYERQLLVDALGVDRTRVSIIPNGSAALDIDRSTPPPPELPSAPFALLLGNVSRRKRQAEIVRALAGRAPVVVAGGFSGSPQERAEWERLLADTGTRWLGHVEDPAAVAALTRAAGVLVHHSAAETQSLAVIEALSVGTPAVLSDIPSHRELAAEHPLFVRLAADIRAVPAAALALLAQRPTGPTPTIPRWSDVAASLERLYRHVVRRANAAR